MTSPASDKSDDALLRDYLEESLKQSNYIEQLRALCLDAVQSHQPRIISTEELEEIIKPKCAALIPLSVKKELVRRVCQNVANKSATEETEQAEMSDSTTKNTDQNTTFSKPVKAAEQVPEESNQEATAHSANEDTNEQTNTQADVQPENKPQS